MHHRLEPAYHRRGVLRAGLAGEGQGGARAAEQHVELVLVGLGDRGQVGDAAVARDDYGQRAQREAQLEALGDFRHRLDPRFMRDLGRGETQRNFGSVGDSRQPLELGAPGLQLRMIVGEPEQCARVALGDSRTLHRRASCASFSSKPRSRRA